MKKMKVHHGMNRTDLDRELIALGGTVSCLRRTGEIVYEHPALASRPRANGRRKDAPRCLTRFVIDVISLLGGEAANDKDYDSDKH